MNKLLLPLCAVMCTGLPLRAAPSAIDYSHIDVYVTPFYNSDGPTVSVGRFSSGLAATQEEEVLATVGKMKKEWERLTFAELYVAAIRLYDLGYRKESVYWFYSAQFRGRQFRVLLDEEKMGSIGSPGFELLQAQNAFFQLVGPFINGYAFGDTEGLIKIVERVQKESRQIFDLEAIYPEVAFIKKTEWKSANDELADGMSKLVSMLKDDKDKEDLRRQRIERGLEEQFSKLTNKDLPDRF
jgi:hypothetical protein